MELKKVVIVLVLFILVIGFGYYYNSFNTDINEVRSVNQVCFDDKTEKCFNVEIAESDEERQKGLMFREELSEDSGMLFIFDSEGKYGFWMKNTPIHLDIIWINSDLEVVYIAEAVPCSEDPCEIYEPGEDALYVLEVNSGVMDEIGVEIGDRVKFK